MFLRHLQDFRIFSRKLSCVSKEVLERPLNTNLRENGLRKGRRLFASGPYIIVTLDPNKLAEKKQQCLHIGDLRYFQPHISLSKQSSPVRTPRLYHGKIDRQTPSCYPPDTKAFLYYSRSQEKPRISGELRLRVVSSDDPASFESGSDLLITNGQPWSRPLYAISKFYSPLYEKLREERLVPDDLDTALSTLNSEHTNYRRSRLLYTLNDTFLVDLSKFASKFLIITEQGVERLTLAVLFVDRRSSSYEAAPYTGTALVRLERSTLLEHKGTRSVVLRCLKIITPVKCVMPFYDGYIRYPREGELHRKIPRKEKEKELREKGHAVDQELVPVWSVDIDKSKRVGFRLLWDA